MKEEFQLKSIRKAKGMKQEELAEAVGVSPQAVSKWEQGGMPDAALLPSVADALGVSIDALFGRAQEEPSFYDRFLQHLSSVPWHEQIGEMYRIGQMFGAAMCGVDQYNEFIFKNIGENQYTEATREEGFYQGRLSEKQPYFLLIPEPEAGYESAVPYDEKFVQLYETLASPNALRALYYIESNQNAYFDAEALAAALSVSLEEAAQIIERLVRVNVVAQASFSSGTKSKTIYQGKAYIELIAFLYFSKMLLNRPNCFTWQTNSRERPWFRGETFKLIL